MTNKFIRYFKDDSRIPGKGSYFASLAINIILLYVVNNLRYMGITQLTEDKLISCLWSANIVFALAILGNFTLLLYRPAWCFYLIQVLINAAAINAFYFIYTLYPFNLGNASTDSIIKIILILIMVGFFAAFLVELYRFGINVHFPKKKTVIAPETLPPDSTQGALDPLAPNPAEGSPSTDQITSGQTGETVSPEQSETDDTVQKEVPQETQPEQPVQEEPAPQSKPEAPPAPPNP